MAWCAGGGSIWRNGSSRNSASQSPNRRSAGSCEPWATANYRPDRVTMRKPRGTRSPPAGPSAAPVQAHRGTNGPLPPTSSVQSARRRARGQPWIMPACNTEAMNLHLAEIAATVAPAAHAILLVDQAGWHLSTRLLVPANITIILLPPKCPELNPVENVWQFMRDNW